MEGNKAHNQPDDASSFEMTSSSEADESRYYPPLTIGTIAICVALTLLLWFEEAIPGAAELLDWVFPFSGGIWSGRVWQLITSVFFHGDIFHLYFNMYWVWQLGGRVERELGPAWWLVFFLSSAFVSSSAELGASGETGIGISGVVCAWFGLMWVCRKRYSSFAQVLTPRLINYFIAFLGLCVVLTWAGVWNIGNAAHITGLLFGCAAGASFVLRWHPGVSLTALVVLCMVCVVPLTWCPWSGEWLAQQGLKAQSRGNFAEAEQFYRRSLRLDTVEPGWMLYNLALIHVERRDAVKFAQTYDRLKALDSDRAAKLMTELEVDPPPETVESKIDYWKAVLPVWDTP